MHTQEGRSVKIFISHVNCHQRAFTIEELLNNQRWYDCARWYHPTSFFLTPIHSLLMKQAWQLGCKICMDPVAWASCHQVTALPWLNIQPGSSWNQYKDLSLAPSLGTKCLLDAKMTSWEVFHSWKSRDSSYTGSTMQVFPTLGSEYRVTFPGPRVFKDATERIPLPPMM